MNRTWQARLMRAVVKNDFNATFLYYFVWHHKMNQHFDRRK